jgi:tetratricopeptide (TPR) repeat protein
MTGWLRLVLMIFYAPLRGMREARDRGALLPIALIALLSQIAYSFVSGKLSASPSWNSGHLIWREVFQDVVFIILIAVVVVPILTFVANIFDRRGSFRVVMTQEYASFVATVLYVITAANIVSIVAATFLHFSGIQAVQVASMIQQSDRMRAMLPDTPEAAEAAERLKDAANVSAMFFLTVKLGFLCIGIVLAVRETFRISTLRSLGISIIGGVGAFFISPMALWLFSGIFGSPFLLFFVFILLRGYFGEIMSGQRSRANFKQNLESATLNPADASAHYNLGLIHQTRGELDSARERFERAIKIDPEEIDASYQLGRIARAQKRYSDAIQHFEQVVARNPTHSQHEVWREVAATYIAAGQYDDARTALQQFLEHRPSDPEGLYLMGRAHAGLGHQREAKSLMQQCIEAVKTAPAYKYRASKRWMNEAQQFLKSQAS